jgi:hypothetical protein
LFYNISPDPEGGGRHFQFPLRPSGVTQIIITAQDAKLVDFPFPEDFSSSSFSINYRYFSCITALMKKFGGPYESLGY